ncbi:hypothetical protein GCM10028816_40360 [Spirosoma lituiforme]
MKAPDPNGTVLVWANRGPARAVLNKKADKDKADRTGITEWVNRSTRQNNDKNGSAILGR